MTEYFTNFNVFNDYKWCERDIWTAPRWCAPPTELDAALGEIEECSQDSSDEERGRALPPGMSFGQY